MKYSLFFAVVAIACSASCKKAETKQLQKAGDRMVGTWTVASIETRVTDTLGTTLVDSTATNQGTLVFGRGDQNAIGAGFFDYADFSGPCATSDLVLYFRNVAAGDPLANGGWSLSWDADPDDLRVQFWGETGGGSYHNSLNHSYNGNTQLLYYVVQPLYQNTRIFYTWTLTK